MEKTKCKPILGLNLNCKLATGLSKNCTLILGQVNVYCKKIWLNYSTIFFETHLFFYKVNLAKCIFL